MRLFFLLGPNNVVSDADLLQCDHERKFLRLVHFFSGLCSAGWL